MDLIYTNSNRVDQGVLQDYELDLAFGADENNLECCVQAGSHCCESGSLLYMEGTEYGGIVDSIESKTDKKEVIYRGRTWHGILNSKVLQPDSGAAYLTVSGEANSVIASLLTRMGLNDLFEASSEASGLTVKSYKMNRYISGYDGIIKMLGTVGGKLKMSFKGGKVVLSAAAVHDYTQDEEFDADLVPFRAKRNYKGVNHLICLGSGELEERMVVHLYADTDGNISQTQTQFGLDEVSAIFEYSNIETVEELIQEGAEKFESLKASDEISIDFDADSDSYDVGDIIGAVDNITGLMAYTTIAKKIVTIKNGQITISLSPDKAKAGSTKEVGGGSSKIECVESFNGRTGAVVPASGDYTAAMVGAAPSGYGLGENAPVVKTTSPLGSGRTGWFRTNDDLTALGLTNGWWFGQYIAYGDNEGVWELNHYLDGLKAVIRIVNGVMQPAEWVNPPMEPNVEYRTTERFMGSPVYAKLIDIGAMPNNTRKLFDHGIADISTSLSVLLISTTSGLDFTNDLNVTECRGTRTQIVVSTNSNFSSYSARALFKYTKTTG